ncbi:TolC family protein [Psychrosphaera sp. 1_MG-2023]|uniref:TolC family protein n=1 Tax=Psychrosphaera sp. 1_MG-2023 TaxID=3062643 RepID=UPI0026E28405|nr:TolC family protein [Psychrosphaera sp. 1_MG-2023]MDO6717824.1 TolC family protein [Psychrosphaera sp. 1_MG-2023]
MKQSYIRLLTVVVLSSVTASCATNNNISIKQDQITVPEMWQNPSSNAVVSAQKVSVHDVIDKNLIEFIQVAVTQNPELKQLSFELEAAKHRVTASGATLWPSLDLNLQSSVRQANENADVVDNASLNLALKYEVDIWGKLSAADQQINLNFLKLQTQHKDRINTLVAEVMTTYFAIVEAKQQLELNKLRLENTQNNLAIIETGYEQGLNDALDVYLTRNDLANEQANISAQTQTLENLVRQFKTLIGTYPDNQFDYQDLALDILPLDALSNTPSDVVKNHPKLRAAWQGLLSSNAAVAFAHKQRFPSFSLSLSVGSEGTDLGKALTEFDLGWSFIGNIAAPLFNAGRLKANENAAISNLQALEQSYISVFLSTFETIERLKANQTNLQAQLNANKIAEQNAVAAEELSFEQYLKGLVNYATVLTSQTRAFNAQSSVIRLQYQLLQNQINLFTALGGDFQALYEQGNVTL